MRPGPNVQSPPLRLGGGFGGVLDQLEDHDHQDDDDQDSDYGPHPWGHCCHLQPGITATRRFLESQVPRRVSDLLPLNRLLSRSSTRLIGTSRSISRILSRPLPAGAIIHLRPLLPTAWCDLPGGSGEQPSSASADAYASF